MSEHSDNYMQGKLSQEELKAFETELSEKEKEELAFEIGAGEGVKEELRNKLKTQVKDFESRASQKKQGIRPAWIGGISASLILLVGVVYIFSTGNDGSLYGEYYESYPNYEMTITRGEEDLSTIQQAYQAYDTKDFTKAERLFTDFLNEESNVPAQFFLGMSRMELEKFDQAIDAFEQVIGSEGDYRDAALWYAALASIKLENQQAAIQLLDQLSDSKEYRIQANDLKSEL